MPSPSPPSLSGSKASGTDDGLPETLPHLPKRMVPERAYTSDTLVPPTPSSDCDLKSEFIESSPADVPVHERFNWRIASGYFAYFMCGYGDGGECPQQLLSIHETSNRSITVMATVLPRKRVYLKS